MPPSAGRPLSRWAFRRRGAKDCFARKDFTGAQSLFDEALATTQEVAGWCPLARSDLAGLLHANLAEVCIQLSDLSAALEHATKAVNMCPTWERG